MSKFFAGGASDSDLSSSEEEDLYAPSEDESLASSSESDSPAQDSDGDDSDLEDEQEESAARPVYKRNQFLKGADSDADSSDDDKKVVKSAREKLLDEIDNAAKAIETALNKSNWIDASAAFDRLTKATDKASKQYQNVPVLFVKTLVLLQTTLAQDAAAKKKLNSSNNKACNIVRQRLKKTQRDYETRLENYSANPDAYEPATPAAVLLASGDVSRASPAPQPATPADLEYTSETVFATLLSIGELRGKKNTDRMEQVSVLEKLLQVSRTNYQKCSVLLMLISLRFDLTSTGSVMPPEAWKAVNSNIRTLLSVLESCMESLIVIASAPEPEDMEKGPVAVNGLAQAPGCVCSLVERLDDEYARALQIIDPHTTEYIERLGEETHLYDLILRAQTYTEKCLARLERKPESSESLCRLLVRRLDHIYYKPTQLILATELEGWKRIPQVLDSALTPRLTEPPRAGVEYTTNLINSLRKTLYKQPNAVFKAKAILYLIYHFALNNNYYKARDLMLMSHLQSTIHASEPAIQVLFNRALVQIGFCAFRVGLIQESLNSLQEICSSNRLKELMGQGVAKIAPHLQPVERNHLLPFHMHINVELIECVYLTASLLTEVPYLASVSNSVELKKKTISKPFRRMLDYHDRQVFTGPTESTRDRIIQAAKCLQVSDWEKASSTITSIKVWGLLGDKAAIHAMLQKKLQVQALRVYLFTFGPSYSSLSLDSLVDLFKLPEQTVTNTVTKMIVDDEIPAFWDPTTRYVQYSDRAVMSKFEIYASSLCDKIVALAERNERLANDGHNPEPKLSQKKGPRASCQPVVA